jgi:iron complex transport system substrate-binding protein
LIVVGVLQQIGPVMSKRWWLGSGALLLAIMVLSIAWYVRGMALAAPDGQLRVVSLSPALTETLFAMGAGEHVVGVSDYCHHPKPAARLAKA